MNRNNKTQWITKTAVMIALLVVLQAVTKAFGQIVTGTCVNFILALSALTCGLSSAITIAVLSPFFAFLLGIGPAFLPIVPGVSLGNTVLVLVLWLILSRKNNESTLAKDILAVGIAALLKFAALYFLIIKIVLPLLSLNEKQAAAISASFSWPQLVTAVIGTTLAILVAPRIKKALKHA